jgi:hypothetical protein
MPEKSVVGRPIVQFQDAVDVIKSFDCDTVSRYVEYWDSIRPRTTVDYMRRWIFAFASVHTGWRANVALYEALKTLDWVGNPERLFSLILASGAGMYHQRTRFIHEFSLKFQADPIWYQSIGTSTWAEHRNELVKDTLGLGQTKVSFALEMCCPTECDVVCLDTHMLQLYGLRGNMSVTPRLYSEMETHWVALCRDRDVPPAIGRHIFWDRKQGETDTRYWAYVFENELDTRAIPTIPELPQENLEAILAQFMELQNDANTQSSEPAAAV